MRLDFLSFMPFGHWFACTFTSSSCLRRRPNRVPSDPWLKPIFWWPAVRRQPSSIFKRPLAETDFLLARLVALTQLHPQRTLGRNRFFCWPALWRQPSSIFKRPLAETDFARARSVASTQGPLADIALSCWPPREMTWAPAKASQQDFRH